MKNLCPLHLFTYLQYQGSCKNPIHSTFLEEIPEEHECAQLLKSINTYAGMPTTIVVPQNSDQEVRFYIKS